MVSNCELSLFILIETWSEREGNNYNHFQKRVVGSNELDSRRKNYQWWAKSPQFNPSILLTDYRVNYWERHFNANNLMNLAHSASGNAEPQKALPREQERWAAVCQGPDPHTLCTPLEAHSLPDSTAEAPGRREASGSPCCLPSSWAWAAALFLNNWDVRLSLELGRGHPLDPGSSLASPPPARLRILGLTPPCRVRCRE